MDKFNYKTFEGSSKVQWEENQKHNAHDMYLTAIAVEAAEFLAGEGMTEFVN